MSQLTVRDLRVEYGRAGGTSLVAVSNVTFEVAAGETLGLVGESGSGKSTVAAAVTRSLPPSALVSGSVHLGEADVLALRGADLRRWWSNEIALVHQDPQASLNPTMRVGRQIEEVLWTKGVDRATAAATALELLARVAMPDPRSIARRYPHELSGGQQQRVIIAMALAVRPRLLVLDEPTTGLDATVERGVLELVAGLRDELSAAVLFITHDLGLVERMCERVAVMRKGEIVETGPTENVLLNPTHEYTRDLLADVPRPDRNKHNDPLVAVAAELEPDGETPLLELRGIVTRFGDVVANDGIDLRIAAGEVVGLVGESGSGKTTLGRVIAGLTTPDEGVIQMRGRSIDHALHDRTREQRRAIQVVFQSPDSTLNPSKRVRQVLQRAIRKLGGRQSVEQLAASVRLQPDVLQQLSSTLSGGQKQRVAIARALAGDANLVVCDEPVSALDVSVQATILRLLADLQRSRKLALLFVSHDLGVVRYLADRVVVMREGRIVEHGPTGDLLDNPQHPYTRELVAASEHRAGTFTAPPAADVGTGAP